MSATDLFSTLQLGDIKINNRAIMAPLTRARAEDHVPTDLMATYYAQRAEAGLIIAEATMVMEGNSAFVAEPGIYSQAQIDGWKKVTDQVHNNGGKIFLQLWHGGRACHPVLNQGRTPVAPSAIAITSDEIHTPEGKKSYVTPRALALDEIPEIIKGFKTAAENAKAAGFDGVEVHGANGYLIDSFLRDSANKRKDQYGGSIENRARFLFEVLQAVIEVWGSGKVGLRTSPLNGFNSMRDSDPVATTEYLAKHLSPLNLAYWHIMRADFKGEQNADVISPARKHYSGNLIANMGYDKDEAQQVISQKQVDAVAFGVPFLANPDLVTRYAKNAELNEPQPDYFYTGGAKGYTDYPSLAE
ncbi:alkene reductase [Gayadomonas joobiniege]|uniref:alkene reductase n=1 Tax=Gayadomonas joobiniege TaxID=1234606 RepID=UPI00036F01D5|nr:alkene reductase [Gayadomonas joobiniege]